jgi:lysozyme
MSVAPGRSLRLTTPSAVLVAFLSAVLLFAASAVVAPGQAFAATATRYAACDGVALRVYAGTTGNLEGRINEGARITIVATVTGGGWRGTCDSSTTTGSRWYRISAVNGKSVSSLYGVRYVYAATGLFRTTATVSATRYAACDDVSLRAYAGTTGMLEGQIETGTAVRVVATVSGGAWKASCAGKSVSGSSWYRISAVDGTSASSLYGRTYVYAATGLFATSAPAVAPDTAPAALSEGIDVSHWQGSVDWDRVRAAGKRFVFLKSSESTDYVDPTYASNRAEARAAGLLVGAYHFAQPGTQSGDAVAEADHFLATARPASGDLLPVLDLEVTNGLSPAQLQTWSRAFLERIYQKTGLRAIIYVSPAFWRTSMGDTTWFADNGYKVLWIAHWTTTASSPSVPGSSWGGEGWTFWQYSSTGTVPGISGRVDLNRYNGTDFRPVLVP